MYGKRILVYGWAAILILTVMPVRAQYKLTLQVDGMTPHIGNGFYVRVIDKASGLEVGRTILDELPAATVPIDLYVLLQGHSYWIDFFADFNGNDQYDTPPADHAWRIAYDNAQGNDILYFTHNVNFTDIQWPPDPLPEDYAGNWDGYWYNNTFATTGDIEAAIVVVPDSTLCRATFTTSGVFGDPATIHYKVQGTYQPGSDYLGIQAPPPLTGYVALTRGIIESYALQFPTMGIDPNILGTYGATQAIVHYWMTGAVQANGYIVMTKQPESAVEPIVSARMPESPSLSQNFPNPFNPETYIRFSLPVRENVTLIVYDLSGREIRRLFDGVADAGSYTIPFHGDDLPSGVYVYIFRSGTRLHAKRMVIMK